MWKKLLTNYGLPALIRLITCAIESASWQIFLFGQAHWSGNKESVCVDVMLRVNRTY